ncbi:acyltransferase [Aquimarina addita]|uniref:Acyltransferase n=1 Tax=Aquimarina addita TaxID=870485 RepID=A0ABP6UII1_9FLAO
MINTLKKNFFLSALHSIYQNFFFAKRRKFGYIHKSAKIRFPALIKGIQNVYIYENSHIMGSSKIISSKAKFILKKNSGAAEGLTVITGTHPYKVGEFFIIDAAKDIQVAKDIIVEEDVWIGTNVTLLPGVVVGRGSIIASGSICRNNVPPYAIVQGNVAKVVGFKFSPDETIIHEEKLYAPEERLDLELLQINYEKHFIKRIKEIRNNLK